ncbi:MAG: DUF2007 domain-containing protein [Muribaculaceae bacterium]|nr:DUF2007 domain-containing protein [Muribaculaceae bacterium]
MPHQEDKLVLLREYDNGVDAHIARGLLETNGILCAINNEIMSSVYPLTPLGVIRLYVRREDVTIAESILKGDIIPD